jgi:PEGA domain
MRTIAGLASLLVTVCGISVAQSGFPVTLSYPPDAPNFKITLSKPQQSGLVNAQTIYLADVTAQNVSNQAQPRSLFTIFINDKDGVRVGRAQLRLPEIQAGQSAKAQLQFSAAGVPMGASLLLGKTVPLNVISIPPQANLKIDGQPSGATPRVVDFTIGLHTIGLSKEGYTSTSWPLEVTGDELLGGGISFELGGQTKDMIILRDGTSALGDVISMSMTSITMRVGGKDQKYERNQVRKIILVERMIEGSPSTQSPSPQTK